MPSCFPCCLPRTAFKNHVFLINKASASLLCTIPINCAVLSSRSPASLLYTAPGNCAEFPAGILSGLPCIPLENCIAVPLHPALSSSQKLRRTKKQPLCSLVLSSLWKLHKSYPSQCLILQMTLVIVIARFCLQVVNVQFFPTV